MAVNEWDLSICAVKKTYANWSLAKKVARQVARRHERPYRVYRCAVCHGLHIGRDVDNWQVKQFKQRRKELSEHDDFPPQD